jgi:hypothetical protein
MTFPQFRNATEPGARYIRNGPTQSLNLAQEPELNF